jgi:hypothetical protein
MQEQQASLIDSRENLFSKLQHQTSTRKITRASVPWMVARLGLQCYSASFRCYVIPFVQQVVIENHIAGIQSHDEYDELRAANTSAECRLLQKFQETCNNGGTAFRNKVRELVMPFFQEGDGKIPLFRRSSGRCLELLRTTISSMTNFLLPEPWSRAWCSYPRLRQTVLCARFQAV